MNAYEAFRNFKVTPELKRVLGAVYEGYDFEPSASHVIYCTSLFGDDELIEWVKDNLSSEAVRSMFDSLMLDDQINVLTTDDTVGMSRIEQFIQMLKNEYTYDEYQADRHFDPLAPTPDSDNAFKRGE